jgi:hypothetical protein
MTDEIQVCGCGKLLQPVYDVKGEKIGVQHMTAEDEDHHNSYFASLRPIEINFSITTQPHAG